MSQMPSVCREIEANLVAAAMSEAEPVTERRVRDHIGRCAPCRGEFERYRAIDGMVATLRGETPPAAHLTRTRAELEARLAALRQRLVAYGVFPSPIGHILIARSEAGVLLVEYLGGRTALKVSRLNRVAGVEAVEDGEEIEVFYRELLEYLEGKRSRLQWPLDLRLARSEFHRAVLQVTARIPYGAVTSYAAIAREVGRAKGVRAVAQALRWNPVPIAVPCHRVIGTSGSLTGYAGGKITLKQRLLAVEGISTVRMADDVRIKREAMYARASGDPEYCLPTCPSVVSVTLAQVTLFCSRERAEAAGLAPCTTCRPDLHPISR